MFDEKKSNENISCLDAAADIYFKEPSEKNLNKVIECSGKLVNYFIMLYGYGHSREDLYQTGIEGLLKALSRYRTGCGSTFATYAGHCIMGEIRHFVRGEVSYYRPKLIEKLQQDIESLIAEELDVKGELPDMDGIARKLNIKEEGVKEVMRAGLTPLDELDLSRIAARSHESFRLPIEDRLVLEQAVNKLSDLQRKVIYLLFYRDMTQEETAACLRLNQRKVSRLLHSGLSQMKSYL